MKTRRAEVHRVTSETDIAVTLTLDGTGAADVSTGIGFLDHMLELFARSRRLRPRGRRER